MTTFLRKFKVETDQQWCPLSKIWTAAEPARLSKEDVSNKNSGVCGTNCVAAGTSIEFNYLLQKILHAVGANKLTTTK